MKFSSRKKAKMRKARLKRIRKNCKDMVGCYLDGGRIIDQANINGEVYFLLEGKNRQLSIYKAVNFAQYVKLSAKRISKLKTKLEKANSWIYRTCLTIEQDGKVKKVEQGDIREFLNRNVCIVIIIDTD